MTDHILEVRTRRHNDGSVSMAYRIGTKPWVDIAYFEESVSRERPDGRWVGSETTRKWQSRESIEEMEERRAEAMEEYTREMKSMSDEQFRRERAASWPEPEPAPNMSSAAPKYHCDHCGRPCGDFAGGHGAAGDGRGGTVHLCHPNEKGRPDCYRRVTVFGEQLGRPGPLKSWEMRS